MPLPAHQRRRRGFAVRKSISWVPQVASCKIKPSATEWLLYMRKDLFLSPSLESGANETHAE